MTRVSDLIYNAELLIKDGDKYYELEFSKEDVVVNAYGDVSKMVLNKGKRVHKKDLLK